MKLPLLSLPNPIGTIRLGCALAGLAALPCSVNAAAPDAKTKDLPNGLRVVAVHFPASTNVSVFTFLPMGLVTDGPGQAQWSHLVEHLIIRSTIPEDSREANAETLPDHMRLDFYGSLANWREGLSHHRRWLEGIHFTEANLDREKPKVNQECDFTARNFATHKFAIAAWSQCFRHGATNVALKGDVLRATLAEIQRVRDDRLTPSNQVTVCIVGGLEPAQVFAEALKQLGDLHLKPAPALAGKLAKGMREAVWDLDARHLVLAWPIPSFRDPDYPALMVAAQCLNQALASTPALSSQAGMTFAGADLLLPEGGFFYISASLRPIAKFEEVRSNLLEKVHQLSAKDGISSSAPFVAKFLGTQLAGLPSTEALKSQVPPGMDPAMVEGNVGLQYGMNEYRYGSARPALARRFEAITAADVQRAAEKYLSDKTLDSCSLKPK